MHFLNMAQETRPRHMHRPGLAREASCAAAEKEARIYSTGSYNSSDTCLKQYTYAASKYKRGKCKDNHQDTSLVSLRSFGKLPVHQDNLHLY